MVAAALLGTAPTAKAAILTWDNDGVTTAAQGGTGTWATNSGTNWWNGTANVVWPAVAGTDDDALFGSTAGTVTIAVGGVTANDLTFNTSGYTVTGGTLTLNGNTPTLTAGTGVTATISSVIAGSSGLTKAGAGTITLNGSAANTFTGGVTVNGGTLDLNFTNFTTPTDLIASGNSLTINGGTFRMTGSTSTITSQTFNGTSFGNGYSVVNLLRNSTSTSTTLSLGTVTASRGTVVYFNTSTALSGTASTTEMVKVSNAVSAAGNALGTWAIGGGAPNTSSARWVTVDAGGVLRLVTANTNIGVGNWSTVNSQSQIYTASAAVTLASNPLAQGIQNNAAANSTIGINLQTQTLTTSGLSVIPATVVWNFSGSGAGNIRIGSQNQLVIMGGGSVGISVPITEGASPASVTNVSGGSLTLSGANTFSGGLATYFGILNINSTTALGAAAGTFSINGGTIDNSSAGAITISNNNPLTLNGDFTFTGTQSLNLGTGAVSLGTAPGTSRSITVTANTLTIGGVIADGTTGTGITKAGAGILALGGNNTYTGATSITGAPGGIVVTANNALGTAAGNTTIANGASLGLSGGVNYSTAETIIGSGGGSSATGAFAVTLRGLVQSVSGNNTFAGAIQVNAAGVTRLGTQNGAQLTLSGPITMSGVTGVTVLFRVGSASGDYVTLTNNANFWDSETQLFTDAAANSGLRLGVNNAIPIATNFNSTGGAGLLDLASFHQELNGLAGGGIIGNSVSGTTSILTLNNTVIRTSAVSIRDGGAGGTGTGKIQVVKIGAFTQALQGQSTFTGGTLIKNGALKLESVNDRLPTTGTVTLGDTNTAGKLILGETPTARNQMLAGLSTTGMGGSVVGASTTGHSILTLNLASNSVFDGTLGGSGTNENQLGLTKAGAGTLTLSGINTYAGPTTISSGILQPGSAQGLSSASAFVTANVAGATLDLNGQNSTIGSLAGGGATGGNVTLGAATLTTGADGTNTTYAGNIIGTGNLTKSGTGTFTLSSAQAYTGVTSLSNGTLLVNASLASSAATVASGATLGGIGTLTNTVTVNSGGTLSPATSTSAGTLSIGSLTLDAGALLNLEFGDTSDLIAVTTPSGLTINGGALSLFATGGVAPLTANGTYTLFTYATGYAGDLNNLSVFNSQAGKTYALNDTGAAIQLLIGTATSSAWSGTAANGLWTTDGGGGNWTDATAPATLGAVVSFGLTPSAATTVTLNGAKTVGSIIFNNANRYTIGTTTDAITLNNGIAAGAISVTAGSHTINAPIVLNGPANIVPAATTSLTFDGAISGAGKALTFSGAGAVTLNAANTFGSALLSAGTLNLGHDSALGSGLVTISGGTIDAIGGARTLSGNNPLTISGDFAFTGTNDLNFGTGAVSMATTRTLSVNAGRMTLGGTISGAGLTKAGPGTLVLSGTNTYTGATTISGGTLIVDLLANGGVASNIGQSTSAAANLVLAGSTLRYTGATATTNRAFSLSAATTNSIEVTDAAANLTLAGASATNTAALTKTGPGVLTISGANGYTGATTVSAGRLALQGTSASTSYAISGGSVLELNSAVTRDYPAASFNGLGTLRKTGVGEVFWGAGAATFAFGSGSLIDVQEGTFKGGSYNNEVWINNLSDLNVVTGAIFAGVEANVRVNKITGAGRIQTGYSGYLNFTIGVDNGSSTFDGTIENTPSHTGNIAKIGSGSIILTGANTYTGTTTVSAGTLTLSGNRTVNAGSVTVGNLAFTAAILNIQGNLPMGGQRFNIGTEGGATGTVNQTSGAVSFTGGDAILIGNLVAGTTGRTTGIYNLSGGSVTTNFGTPSTARGVMVGGNAGATGNLINATFNLSGGSLNNTTGALIVVRASDGAAFQNSTYNQTGGTATNGTLIIGGNGPNGANSIATFAVTGGTLSSTAFTLLSAGNNVVSTMTIGGTADVTLPAFPTVRGTGSTATLYFNGGTLKPVASSTAYLGGLTNAFIQAGGTKFDTNNFDITVSQALLADSVSTGGGLTKAGNGVLTLSGANTFTGGASIEAGVLALGSATAFNATAGSESTVSFGAGSTGTLRLNGNSVVIANLSSNVTPGAPVVENAFATNATLTVGNSANLVGNFAGVIRDGSGGGLLGLTKAGNGTLTLSGANTYSGSTTISAGILAAGAANAFSANSDVVLADNAGAILSLNDFAQTIKSLNGGGTTGGNVSLGSDTGLSVIGAGSFGGVISGTGSSGLTKAGTGTQTLTGASTYSGPTSVTGGTLALSGTGSVNASNGVTINGSGASFAHTGSVAISAPVTLTQGSITGTGTVNALTVADLSANVVTPGTAGVGTLTVRNLNFLGAAKIDFTATGSVINGLLSTTSLSTNGSENVFINIAGVPLGGWTSGTYDLISYGTLGGSGLGAFKLGTLAGTTARTTSSLVNQSSKISLSITNNTAKWSGADDGVWSGTTIGNWILRPSNTPTSYIEGEAVVFDDTASGTTIVTIGSGVKPSSVVFNNFSKAYTLEGEGYLDISEQQTVGLVKNGTGTLTINATNLYSGATVINAGNITMGLSGSLGQNAPLTLAGGQLDLGPIPQLVGPVSITSASSTGFTIDNGILRAPSFVISNPTGDALISATLSGNGATLTKSGAGNATLSAPNTFSGAVTVNAGVLMVTGLGSLGSASAINLAGGSLQLSSGVTLPTAVPLTFTGGSLDLGTSTQAVGAVSVANAAASGATIANGSLTGASYAASNATGDAVINAALLANDAIGFTKTGNGRVTLGGANTYTGATTVSAGTLAAGSSLAFTGLNELAISGSSTFDLNGYNATFSGNVTTAPATVTITDTAAGSGTSTIRFLQTSNTTITTPTLIVDGPSRKVAVTLSNANGDQRFTNANNTFSGGINILGSPAGGRMSVSAVPVNTFVSGVLTASPYGTGPITVGQAATDRAGIFIPTANVTLANPIVANTTLGTDRVGTFRIDATGLTLSGQLTAGASDMALSTNGTGTVTVTGRITGSNGLRLLSHTQGSNPGSLTVTLANVAGTNDYNGNTTINDNAQAGRTYTLVLGASDQIPNGAGKGNVVINSNGTGVGSLRLQGFSDTINGLTGTGNVTTTVAGASVLTLGDGDATASFGGTITESIGTVGLAKIGAGTQTLTTSMAYTGGTTVTAGTLVLGHGTDTLADTGAVTVNGGTLSLGANNETVGTVTLSTGTISGTTGVLTSTSNYDLRGGTVAAILGGAVGANKTTGGTTTVTSVVAYTGATSVTNGTLLLNGTGDLNSTSGITVNGAGAKFVQSSSVAVSKAITLTQGTVTGSGTINTVNVGAGTGGIISNNDGVGGAALTIGTLTFEGAGVINTFSNSTSPAIILGSLTTNPAGIVTVNPSAASWDSGSTYQLISLGGIGGAGAPQIALGSITGLTSRQSPTFLATASAVTLQVVGDNPFWLGGSSAWNTSATGNWKLVAGGTETTFRTADSVLFNDDSTGTTTIDVDAGNITPTSTTFANSAKEYVLGSSGNFGIASGSLTKAGTGTLTINNANTYAGPTMVTGGSLILNGSLGSTAITIGGAATFSQASSSVIGGTASITSSGTLTLAGANTFTGGFTLNAGTANVRSSTALGSGPLTINGGTIDNTTGASLVLTNSAAQAWNGNFVFTGSSDLSFGTGPVTLGASRNVTVAASTLTIVGQVGGSGLALTKAGNGTLILGGAGTYSGATTVNGGRLSLQGASASPSFSVASAAVLELNAASDRDYVSTSVSGAGALRKTGSGAIAWGAAAATFSLGSGALIDVREGTFTGGSGGNEVWTNNLADLNVESGALFNSADAAVRVNRLTGAGTVRAGSASLTIGADNGSSTFDGIIENVTASTGNLVKAGSGTITLTGANTYTGTTTVSGGTLTLSGNRAGNIGNITVGNTAGQDATLNITAGTINLGAGEMTVGNAPTTGMTGTVNQTGGQVIFSAGAGNQLLIGRQAGVANRGIYNLSGGSLTIGLGVNSGRGIILGVSTGNSGGTFNLSGTGVLNMTLASGGTGDSNLSIGRFDATADNTTNAFNQTGGTANVGVLAVAGGSTGVSSTLSLTGGTFRANVFNRLAQGTNSTAVINIGGTADVTLPAFPTTRGTGATATLNFDGGTLKPLASSATYLGGLTNAFVKAGGAWLDTNAFDITVSQALLADSVSTGGGLTKVGNGVLTLSGTNTYTGATTVTGGTLALSGASNNNIASSSGISLGNGTTLSLGGLTATAGTLTLASGQTLTATGATATVTGTALNTSGNNTLSTTGGTLTLPRLNVFGTGNQFTGGNLSSGGTNRGLVIGSSTGAGALTISGGSFSTAGAQQADVIGNDQDATLTVNGGTFTGAATTVLGLNSGLSWTSTLTVSGSGTANLSLLQLSAANSVVNLDGGTLTVQQIVDLDNQGVAGASNTTFNFNGGLLRAAAGANATFLSGLTNAFVKAGGARIDTNGQNIAIGQALLADPVSTGGSLTKSGNGTLTLTGSNTYTGTTTVNGGTLRVASLGTTGASSVGSSDRAIAANLALNGPVRLEYAGTGETTSRSFTISGSGVTLASSGTSGAIEFTSSANVAFADAGASTRELKLAGTNTGNNTFAASAVGTPAAADVFRKIVKNEVGKWIIAGSGTTFADNLQVEVNAGLLAFAGTRTGATVTVNNGGTLGGSTSLGAVTVNNGGALSPGSSPGVFTSSSLSLAGGSIINWQVSDAFGGAGIGYDQLAVTGNLDLRGASATNKIVIKISSITAQDVNGEPLNFGAPNGVSSIRTFQFGQVGGLLQTNGENISDLFTFDVSDFDYTGGTASNAGLWSINWNAGAITLTAVPEPSTYGLGLGALALAAAALRRRRRLAPKA